jgi:hypothetical protein
MVAEASIGRSGEQLKFILCEAANWTVNAVHGMVLCEAANLRLAIGKAVHFAARGQEFVAIIPGRAVKTAVLPGQNWKLTNLEGESVISPLPRVAAFISETADGFDGPRPALMPNGAIYREATPCNAVLRK